MKSAVHRSGLAVEAPSQKAVRKRMSPKGRKPMRWSVVLLVLAAASAPMAAADGQACSEAPDQSTMNLCADKAFKKADAELNTLYKQIGQRLKDNADATKLLVAAQRGWVGFRDAECKFASSGVSGGSAYPMIYSGCAERVTRTRITELQSYLNCREGDTSCPVPAN
jgi:uncharacterized protein YecT (DUF1311 family)